MTQVTGLKKCKHFSRLFNARTFIYLCVFKVNSNFKLFVKSSKYILLFPRKNTRKSPPRHNPAVIRQYPSGLSPANQRSRAIQTRIPQSSPPRKLAAALRIPKSSRSGRLEIRCELARAKPRLARAIRAITCSSQRPKL